MDEGNALGRFELPILDRAFKADPYRVYEALRGTGKSVIPVRLPTGVEAWLVIGYETARRLLNDARLSKRPAGTAASGNEPQLHPLFRHLLMLDPPEHTRLR
ncbi:MAG TPA: hypothetical protein VFL97_07845, partial [Nitrococcus sp.]|nr:hypothetical protein [Nitrococcus sp.]